jgi:hypothetical protein
MSAERRRQIAEIIDGYDTEIKGLNDGKADTWGSYREELLASGLDASSVKAEIAALKAAIVKRRKLVTHPAEIQETDRLIEEIVTELLSMDPSRVRTHEAAEHVRPPRPPRSAYQPPRMASPRELIQARRGGKPDTHDPETGEVSDPDPGLVDMVNDLQAGGVSIEEKLSPTADRPAGLDPMAHLQDAVQASKPYRVTDLAPATVAPDPDVSPLIADKAARMAEAAKLLGQGAAE